MSEKITIYSDGGARGNPGPAAIGVLILDEKGKMLEERGEVIGEATNNVAEYTAVLVGLEMAARLGAKKIQYFVDSELVARQIAGQYKVRMPHLLILYRKVKEKEKAFESVRFTHVRREHPQIQHVDALVNEALDQESR